MMTAETSSTVTLQEAADALGVHYMTAYKYVRTGLLPAAKVGAAWQVAAADLERFQQEEKAPGKNRRRTRSGYAGRIADRLAVGDEAGASELIESTLASGATLDEVYLDLMVPALVTIGERWAAGEIPIAAEHQASAIVQRLIGRLGPRFMPRGRRRGTVVLGAAPTDHHGLPTALLADLLRLRRFEVIDLGADTPADAFAEACRDRDRLLAVGICATVSNDKGVRASVKSIKAAGFDVPVLVGGAAITDEEHARRLGADAWTGAPRGATDAFEAALQPTA